MKIFLLEIMALAIAEEAVVSKECLSDCLEYNEESARCEVKNDLECTSLKCDFDGMKIEFSSRLFNIQDPSNPNFSSEVSPTFKDGKWTVHCKLGQCGMTLGSAIFDYAQYLTFTIPISAAAAPKTVNGMEVHINEKVGASLQYQCRYKADVKVASDDIHIQATNVKSQVVNYGTLEEGFDINLFLDEGLSNPVTETNVFVGNPIYVAVDWKVTSLMDMAAFYVDDCDVEFGDRSLSLVDRNCYAAAFGAKMLQSEKVVSKTSKFEFKSFIVGKSKKTMKMNIVCTLKVCTTDEEKCERNLSTKEEDCDTSKVGYQYKP